MGIRQKAVFSKGLLIFLVLVLVSFLWPSSPVYAEKEKIGVLFISVGENDDYVADWSIQFFNNMYDVFNPGFFAGGPLEGGTCYTQIHYANEAEASICGVDLGTPIDQFCNPYNNTDLYPVHTLWDHWPPDFGDNDFVINCSTAITPVMYILTFSHTTDDPSTGELIYGPVVLDPNGTGLGIADFLEMNNWSRMGWYYRWPDHKCYARKELLKWWYGNNAPGYSPDSPELINVKATLEALHPEYDFIYGHGWEAYMENEDAYGNPLDRPDSTETVIKELIDGGAKKIVVADVYSGFSNLTQFGHEWYENGQPISALPGKTFKECVEDLTDGKGPATQADLDAYRTNKSWDKHWKHPFPLIKSLVQSQDPTVDVRFANAYGMYPEFEQAVVDVLNYTIAKYSIPSTASLKVILLQHGYYKAYANAQECDSYFKLTNDLVSRAAAKIQSTFTWSGKFDLVSGPGEFAEGDTYDPASSGKPFGNVISAGELVDQSINGQYVNGLGTLVDNGTNNYDYIIAMPFTFESFSSDTIYGKREQILGNNVYSAATGYTRDTMDKDGTEYDTGDIDSEYYTVKTFDGTGWLGGRGASKTPKGSVTNPTTIIITGCILDLNSASGLGRSARENLTMAEVKAISDALGGPTLITLASFDAVPGNRSVTLKWVTESEVDNAGFNLYRSKTTNGDYIKMNGALIPAEGSSTHGATYEFVDTGLKNGVRYSYILEDIDIKGKAEKHGPESATPRLIYAPLRDVRK